MPLKLPDNEEKNKDNSLNKESTQNLLKERDSFGKRFATNILAFGTGIAEGVLSGGETLGDAIEYGGNLLGSKYIEKGGDFLSDKFGAGAEKLGEAREHVSRNLSEGEKRFHDVGKLAGEFAIPFTALKGGLKAGRAITGLGKVPQSAKSRVRRVGEGTGSLIGGAGAQFALEQFAEAQGVHDTATQIYNDNLKGIKTSKGLNLGSISKEGLKFIIKHENLDFSGQAYQDGKTLAIGYGVSANSYFQTTGKKLTRNTVVTEQEAVYLMDEHIKRDVKPYVDALDLPTQSHYDMMTSLIYNAGYKRVKELGIIKDIKKKDWEGVYEKMSTIVNDKYGVKLNSLVERRKEEIDLMKRGDDEFSILEDAGKTAAYFDSAREYADAASLKSLTQSVKYVLGLNAIEALPFLLGNSKKGRAAKSFLEDAKKFALIGSASAITEPIEEVIVQPTLKEQSLQISDTTLGEVFSKANNLNEEEKEFFVDVMVATFLTGGLLSNTSTVKLKDVNNQKVVNTTLEELNKKIPVNIEGSKEERVDVLSDVYLYSLLDKNKNENETVVKLLYQNYANKKGLKPLFKQLEEGGSLTDKQVNKSLNMGLTLDLPTYDDLERAIRKSDAIKYNEGQIEDVDFGISEDLSDETSVLLEQGQQDFKLSEFNVKKVNAPSRDRFDYELNKAREEGFEGAYNEKNPSQLEIFKESSLSRVLTDRNLDDVSAQSFKEYVADTKSKYPILKDVPVNKLHASLGELFSGRYSRQGGIELTDNLQNDTLLHEGLHNFADEFLSSEDKKRMYRDARVKYKEDYQRFLQEVKANPYNVGTDEAELQEIAVEEMLVEKSTSILEQDDRSFLTRTYKSLMGLVKDVTEDKPEFLEKFLEENKKAKKVLRTKLTSNFIQKASDEFYKSGFQKGEYIDEVVRLGREGGYSKNKSLSSLLRIRNLNLEGDESDFSYNFMIPLDDGVLTPKSQFAGVIVSFEPDRGGDQVLTELSVSIFNKKQKTKGIMKIGNDNPIILEKVMAVLAESVKGRSGFVPLIYFNKLPAHQKALFEKYLEPGDILSIELSDLFEVDPVIKTERTEFYQMKPEETNALSYLASHGVTPKDILKRETYKNYIFGIPKKVGKFIHSRYKKYLGLTGTNIRALDEKIWAKLSNLEARLLRSRNNYLNRSKIFSKAYGDLSEPEKGAFQLALMQKDFDTAKSFLKNDDAFTEVRIMIRERLEELKASGYDVGEIEFYFPRKVKDKDGLTSHFLDENNPKYAFVREKIAQIENEIGTKLTPEEKFDIIASAANLVNIDISAPKYSSLRDYIARVEKKTGKPLTNSQKLNIFSTSAALSKEFKVKTSGKLVKARNLFERTIDVPAPEIIKYYEDPLIALDRYFDETSNLIELSTFFGEHKHISDLKFVLEMSVDRYLASETSLPLEKQKELKGYLMSTLKRLHTPSWATNTKAIIYIATLNSIRNALVQIGDVALTVLEHGPVSTLVGIRYAFSKKKERIDPREVFGNVIAQEIQGDTEANFRSLLNRAQRWVFKYSGFTYVDFNIGKNILANTIYQRLRKQALKGEGEFIEDIQLLFPDKKERAQVIQDLIDKNQTEAVYRLLNVTANRTQPISFLDQTPFAQQNPHFRILYTLTSYTLKVHDIVRRKSLQRIANGVRANDYEEVLLGVRGLFYIAALLIAFNVPIKKINNFLAGREDSLEDLTEDVVLSTIGYNKYGVSLTGYKAKGLFGSITTQIPVTTVLDKMLTDRAVTAIPFGGDLIYPYIKVDNGKNDFSDLKFDDFSDLSFDVDF